MIAFRAELITREREATAGKYSTFGDPMSPWTLDRQRMWTTGKLGSLQLLAAPGALCYRRLVRTCDLD